jgi:hypothetical protein
MRDKFKIEDEPQTEPMRNRFKIEEPQTEEMRNRFKMQGPQTERVKMRASKASWQIL